MNPAKIAVIGAGSASFGPPVVVGLIGHPQLDDIHLCLHDVDPAAVERAGRFASLLAHEAGRNVAVAATTERAACLDGADCVIISLAVDREETWARDRAIAERHGILHYGENGGPAAIAHTARNLAQILPIARAMERRCPDAWLVNYTNPVPRIGTALGLATTIRSVGVCHQIDFGYFMIGCLLADDLGLARPTDCRFRWTDESIDELNQLAAAARQQTRIVAAGLNHFTWVLALERRADGQDLLPLLRERSRQIDPAFEPLTRQIFELFDAFPVPGDCHLAEYLPYTHNPARGGFGDYAIQAYDHQWSEAQRRRRVLQIEAILESGDAGAARAFGSERAEEVVSALLGRGDHHDEALNVPNGEAITNLPPQAIVEVPVTIGSTGPVAQRCGALPEPVAELCRRQVVINQLCAEGLCTGDRHKLEQALALDPMIDDPRLPERLLTAYLEDSWRYVAPLFE